MSQSEQDRLNTTGQPTDLDSQVRENSGLEIVSVGLDQEPPVQQQGFSQDLLNQVTDDVNASVDKTVTNWKIKQDWNETQWTIRLD